MTAPAREVYRPCFFALAFAHRAAAAFLATAVRCAAETPFQRALPPFLPISEAVGACRFLPAMRLWYKTPRKSATLGTFRGGDLTYARRLA